MTDLVTNQLNQDILELQESFVKNGIIKLKLFEPSQLEGFRNLILSKLFHEYQTRTNSKITSLAVFESEILPFFETEHKELWNGVYRNIMMSKELFGLVSSLFELPFQELFGIQHATLCNSPNLKINLKNDEAHLVHTHQDFQSHFCSLNGITVWIPLQHMSEELGPIEYIKGSHKEGVLPSKEGLLTDSFEKASFSREDMEFGDCLIFSQLLVHRSSVNKSSRARISCQIRFTDFGDEDWRKRNFMSVERKTRDPLNGKEKRRFLVASI